MSISTFVLFITLTASFPQPLNLPAGDGQYMDGKVTKRFGVYVDITGDDVDHVETWPAKNQTVTICIPKKTKTKSTGKKKKSEPLEYVAICKAVVYDVDEGSRIIEIQLTENFEASATKKGFPEAKMKKDQQVRLIWDNYGDE